MIEISGLVKRYPGKTVNRNAVDGVDLTIESGQMVTLLGPSGCGKTTTLRLIAGLERPDAGVISIDGKVVADPAKGVVVPTYRRPIGIVFQSYAIWPHMSVVGNVMFPLRVERHRISKTDARDRAMKALDMVGLSDFADRSATALSGGQQQRVALARALVREPSVLLLDEPLSNLDAGLRDEMRDQIRALQSRLGITAVFVTHDQDEAMALSDEVIVMSDGVIVEAGKPEQVYSAPANAFTAKFLGVDNVMDAEVVQAGGESVKVTGVLGEMWCVSAHELAVRDHVRAFIRPDLLKLSASSSAEAWPGTVESRTYQGHCVDYVVSVAGQPVRVRLYESTSDYEVGSQVFVTPDRTGIFALPLEAA